MKIEDLKEIGKDLIKMVSKNRFSSDAKKIVQIGAAGDKTFQMDKKAEDIILSYLEALNVPIKIISEEYGYKEMNPESKGKRLNVLIDPIDGSKNAISGIPMFSTSIAVANGDKTGDIFIGYVLNLVSGDEFWAEKGKGAFLNGKRIETQDKPEIGVILYEAQEPSIDLPKILPMLSQSTRARCLGSTALDLAYLSYGSASIFVTPSNSRSIDFAGGLLLIEEAGGVITDIKGNRINNVKLGLEKSTTLLASANKGIHKKALYLLNKK